MYEDVGPGICERDEDEWKLDLDWWWCFDSLGSSPYGLFDSPSTILGLLSNDETTSPATANGEWLGSTVYRDNVAVGAPIITDNHVRANAIDASLHFPGCSEVGFLHKPFPFLEAARIERAMAPDNERTSRMKNATRLGTRLGSASRRLYFNTQLGQV